MRIGFLILMFVVGAVMGSFAACQAWRLRYKEQGRKSPGKYSVCLKCGHRLRWYENIPVVSWLLLGGKCAKCGRKIGTMEIWAEVLMGLAFAGVAWSVGFDSEISFGSGATLEGANWLKLVVMLLLVVILGFLAIYDGMWGELPTWGLIVALVLAVGVWIIGLGGEMPTMAEVNNLLGAVGILGGVYLVLYLASWGKWVGNGDWLLGGVLAIALGEAWLALITLFVANFLGCIVSWPKVKGKKQKKVYFGPFLVIAFVIAVVFVEIWKGLIV